MKLERGIHDLMNHIGQKYFGNRVFLSHIESVLCLVGNMHQHETRFVNLGSTVRQHELHTLTVRELFPERLSLQYMLGRHVERSLCFSNVVHTMPQTTVAKAVLAHVEPLTPSPQQIRLWNDQIVNLNLAVGRT